MISKEVDFDSIPKDSSYFEMMDGLRDDRLSISDFEDYLGSDYVKVYALTVDDKYIGFYSVEDGHVNEVHAYILPEHRRHSIRALRYMDRVIPHPITTSVYGTHEHVCKVLERMGYEFYYKLTDVYQKGGKTYDITYFNKRGV